jgi:hypothetical protein
MAATSTNNNNSDNKLLTELFKRLDKFEQNVDEHFKSINRPAGDEIKKPWVLKDHGGYCHTHGYCVIKKQTSLNCRNNAPGHKEEATRENNMGGSQNGKPTSTWQAGANEKAEINEIINIDAITRTPPLATNKPAIFDSGTMGHYILLDTACINKWSATKPISVKLPNGQYIESLHVAMLPFPNLPAKALEAHVFPGLNDQALLSIGTFCDAGCTATFTATEVIITLGGQVVLSGRRQPPGLWKTAINKPLEKEKQNPWQKANGAYTTQLWSNAIKFMHAACFSPTTATWTKAIDAGAFQSWPGLTSKAVRQLLPKSMETAMGHLDQQRKNLRSTKVAKPTAQPKIIKTSKLETILEEDDNNEGWVCATEVIHESDVNVHSRDDVVAGHRSSRVSEAERAVESQPILCPLAWANSLSGVDSLRGLAIIGADSFQGLAIIV